ncbi:MAG: glycosyltransferase [Lachnospiraceae bacterium]|nr:glycosyltransferase [Lachnospiraceae bacterium]
MEQKMFSIVVVSLNAGEKLLKTIDSIVSQTYSDYEVVVKDGGSKDGSVDALREKLSSFPEEWKERIHIFEEKDGSIYEGMNQAVEKTTGKYLYFLNCGDYFYSNEALEQLAWGIQAKEDMEAHHKIYYGDIYDALRGNIVASNPKLDGFGLYRNVPCHQACFYERSLFEKRGYKPEYKVRADYEHFLYSVYKEDAKPCYISAVLASYEGGGFSETKENRKRSEKERREIVKQYMGLGQRMWYRTLLLLTLAPLRTRIAEDPKLASGYNRVKNFVYGRK